MTTESTPAPCFLSLDQGGSASRALVFDGRGQVLASARVEVGHRRPQPGWVEQDPEAVLASLRAAADAALAQLASDRRAQLQSAGLVCQRSSLLAWDRQSGAALSPILSWQDTRASDWLRAQALDAEVIHARTGLYPNAHFGLSKLRWLLEHNADVRRAADAGRLLMGPLAAFLVFRLLAERPCLVDPANASRTLLLDLRTGDWDAAMLDRFGIQRAWLPSLARSDHDYGTLSLASAQLPLRLLSGDQSAAAFAFGAPRGDVIYANLGTGAFAYRLAERPPRASRLLASVIPWDAAPQFVVEGTVNGAGSALAWFEQEFAVDDGAALLQQAWSADVATPLLFINAVGGLGSPDWRADLRPQFLGEGSLAERALAVAESIVFLLQRNLECLRALGGPCAALVVSGGLARSDAFCQALSDLAELRLRRPEDCEASARGAAFLLAGRPSDWRALPEREFLPRSNPGLQARYARWTEALNARLRG